MPKAIITIEDNIEGDIEGEVKVTLAFDPSAKVSGAGTPAQHLGIRVLRWIAAGEQEAPDA